MYPYGSLESARRRLISLLTKYISIVTVAK